MRDEEKYTNTEEQLLYLQKLLDEEDTAALNELFNELDILAIARTLESFPAKTRDLLWEYIPETMLGEVLAEVDEDIRADYIEDLTASDVEQIVKGLDAQEVAEVLDVADEEIKTTVYASLDQEIRAQVENLHAYEEDMVGRYMDPETVNV
ncbi:MAG TPA: magnesium transporter, partial [Halomonas sp.]|nr:magnesium transporter [Halomonas sp.]